MRSWKAGILLLLAGLPALSQTMPYPVGWVYTASILDLDNLAFIGSTVADTGGASGHTTSAVVKLMSPDGRVSYGTGGWDYSSFAAGSLSFCDSSGQCFDGWFRASSEGTQEYCPIAFTYMVVAESMEQNEAEPFAYAKSARWVPSAIPYRNGQSDFILVVGKTPACGAGNAKVEVSVTKNPSMLAIRINPDPGSQRTIEFSGPEATASWQLETLGENNTIGTFHAAGRLMGAPCRILPNPPQNSKDAELKVEAP